jgi:tetratricopeptide (TPR) repeat protein
LKKDLTPDLDKIIMECLQKEPTARFVSAKTLQAAVDSIELGSTRERSGIYARLLWINIFVFLIIFGSIFYLFREMNSNPLHVQTIEEIQFPKTVRLNIEYEMDKETPMDRQTQLLGFIELVQERLERNPAVHIVSRKSILGADQDVVETAEKVDYTIDFRFSEIGKKAKLGYFVTEKDGKPAYQSSLAWNNFDGIFWLSTQFLSQFLKIVLDKDVVLDEPETDIRNNLNAYRYFAHGLYHFKEKNYDMAVQRFDEALKVNPFFSQAHYYKGMSLFRKNLYQQALTEFYSALPEISKQSLIDWQVIFDDTMPRLHEILPIQAEGPQTSETFYISSRGTNNIKIFNPESRGIFEITPPGEFKNFVIETVFSYKNSYVFVLFFKINKCHRVAIYHAKNQKWETTKEINYRSQVYNLPYLYYVDKDNNRIVKFDMTNLSMVASVAFPDSGYGSTINLRVTSDKSKVIALAPSDICLVDFDNHKLQFLSEKVSDITPTQRSRHICGDFILLSPNDSMLCLYNTAKLEKIGDLPLGKFERIGFAGPTSSTLAIDGNRERFYVIQPDTFLSVFSTHQESEPVCIARFPLNQIEGNLTVYETRRFTSQEYDKDFLAYDKQMGVIWIFDYARPESCKAIRTGQEIKKILFNAKDLIVVRTALSVVAYDKSSGDILWELSGTFTLRHIVQDKKHLLIFVDMANNRIAFYQYYARRFAEYYQATSPRNVMTTLAGDHLYFFENHMLQGLNLNTVLQRNPTQLVNIYHRIAECYFELQDDDNVKKYASKILDELQSSDVESLILLENVALRDKDKLNDVMLLPRIYNLLPRNSGKKALIENEFFRSGLYSWERSEVHFRGSTIFDASGGGVYYANISPARTGWLLKLKMENGNPVSKYPYQYRFNGILIDSTCFFYSQIDDVDMLNYYYLLDLQTGKILTKLPMGGRIVRVPKIYKSGANSVVVFFRHSDTNPGVLQNVDLENNCVHDIARFNEPIAEPYVENNTVYFIARDSLFSYNIRSQKLTVRKFENPKGIQIQQIIRVTARKIILRSTGNHVCVIDRKTSNELEISGRLAQSFPPLGYVDGENKLTILNSDNVKEIQLGNNSRVVNLCIKDDAIFVLLTDEILKIENGRIAQIYPLLWPAFDFDVEDNHAYVLASEGKIYSVDLNWTPDKLKKGLILNMN